MTYRLMFQMVITVAVIFWCFYRLELGDKSEGLMMTVTFLIGYWFPSPVEQ